MTSRTIATCAAPPIKIPAAPIMSEDPDSLRPSEVPGGSQIAVRARNPAVTISMANTFGIDSNPCSKGLSSEVSESEAKALDTLPRSSAAKSSTHDPSVTASARMAAVAPASVSAAARNEIAPISRA